MPLSWLEKPEIDLPQVLEQFYDLHAHYLAMSNGSMVKFWTRLAEKMSQAINRPKPWGWRYPQGVYSGKIKPSRDFARAVALLLAEIDGLPAQIGRLEEVNIYAEPGTVQHGAIIVARSQVCANPGCNRVFVPNTPARKKCPICSPTRARKLYQV